MRQGRGDASLISMMATSENRSVNVQRHQVETILGVISENPAAYFYYEDTYCDEVGCEVPHCDVHFGSVLDVEYHSDRNGCYLGCIIYVGNVLDYAIKLNTRTGELTASNGIDVLKRIYDPDQCAAVDTQWSDTDSVLMRD